jgi:branched-chain amino acid transport system permease protein
MIRLRLKLFQTLGLALALFFLLWPIFAQEAHIYCRVFAMAYFYAALAFSWNLYALTGAISLGHAAFFGLGAYGSALASHYWSLSPFASIFWGGFLGAAYGAAWSVIFKNLRGSYLALATLASVEIPRVLIDNWENVTGGSLGHVGITGLPSIGFGEWSLPLGSDLRAQYYFFLIFMASIACIHYKAISSQWGWAIRAVREDETAAASLGVNVFGVRFQALLLSAFLTGVCGGLYAHLIGLLEPSLVFNLHISALPLVLSIFGGRYQAYGPLLGALLLYPPDQLLFHKWLPSGHAVLYGLVIIATVLFFPEGIAAWLKKQMKSF